MNKIPTNLELGIRENGSLIKATVYLNQSGGFEAHAVGENVIVAWEVKDAIKTVVLDGITYYAHVPEHIGKPYILFANITKASDGEITFQRPTFLKLSGEEVEKLIGELTAALRYLQAEEADAESEAE